jgi:hypothetical protein
MTETPQSLAERLRGEGGRVVDFFNHLSRGQWGIHDYPQETEWSFHQLLAHFVSSEIARKELIINIYQGGKGAPPDFEIDAFNQSEVEKLSAETDDGLLQRFSRERAILIELVSGMSGEDLEIIGNDPFLGAVALSEMIKLTYRHLQIYMRDARQYL